MTLRVGVLAMQGAFDAHLKILRSLGAEAFAVRTEADLASCQALVLPGGESTAIRKALVRADLYDSLRARIERGMPTLATCAGMIVLARAEPDGAPDTYGILDVDVVRNGFGAQRESFETDVSFTLEGLGDESGAEESRNMIVNGVFIRAPRVQNVGDGVTVIARLNDEPVAVRQDAIVACTWHPELNEDSPLHAWFLRMAGLSSAAARVAVSPS